MSWLSTWIKGLFHKADDFAKKAWKLLQPFLQAILNEAQLLLMSSLREMALTAARQISEQGLPTDEAKREAFAKIMREEAKIQGHILSDSMLNFLREIVVQILKSQT